MKWRTSKTVTAPLMDYVLRLQYLTLPAIESRRRDR